VDRLVKATCSQEQPDFWKFM